MTVYVDNFRSPATVGRIRGRWSHLTADSPSIAEIRTELAGRDLACWCDLAMPCHGDILLDLANSVAGSDPSASDAR